MGWLSGLTKQVLEGGLEAELTEHLGYDKHDPAGRDRGNSHNGARFKTVTTDIGPVEIEVPRDRGGSFEPQLVKKRQRRLSGGNGIFSDCGPETVVKEPNFGCRSSPNSGIAGWRMSAFSSAMG
jgi:hypothetical protein